MTVTEHASFCRICAAACGVIVTLDDTRVVTVKGDPDHPISRGYTCEKGRALPTWHHSGARLDLPRLRGRSVGWGELLDDLSAVIGPLRTENGDDSIGMYLATGMAYDSLGQVACGMWMGAIGSSSFYSAATVDNAPVLVVAERIAGHAMLNPVWEPDTSRLLLLLATNPVISHGYGTTLADPIRRLRDFRRSGGRIWTIDPRRTETAWHSDEHLAVRPGSDVILLGALVRELLGVERCRNALELACRAEDIKVLVDAVAPFTIEAASIATGSEPSRVQQLATDIEGAFGHVAMFCGTGSTMAIDGVLVEWLRWVLLAMTDSLDVPGGMRFNRGVVNRLSSSTRFASPPLGPRSRPELPRVAGQLPAVAMVDEIESGHLRALIVAGGNPLSAFPEPDRVRHALASLDALVVIDVAESEMCDLATHLMPATGQLERADLTLAEQVSFRSGLQFTRAVVEPQGERRPVWWMFAQLAQRLGRPLFGGVDPDLLDDESILSGLLSRGVLREADVVAIGPHGIDLPVEFGWVREEMTADGRWNIAPPEFVARLAGHRGPEVGLVMVPRRGSAWSNSVRFAGDGGEAIVAMHPSDARTRGLLEGEWVAVSSQHGSLVGTVSIDETSREGVVSITHGHPGSLTGSLTSSQVDVDLLTTMPRASGLPIRVERLAR